MSDRFSVAALSSDLKPRRNVERTLNRLRREADHMREARGTYVHAVPSPSDDRDRRPPLDAGRTARPTGPADDPYHSADKRSGEGQPHFEHLFRISPVPMLEQDYTRVVAWMEQLRRGGVTDIRKEIGREVEAIRALVPMIDVIAANPAAMRAVGLPHHRLIGPIDPVIVNEGAVDSWLSQFEAVWEGRPVSHAEFEAATASGRRYDAESTLSAPIIDGRPDYSHAVFTLIDVTSHRDQERRMASEIQAKSAFLASVSHEIRTPLTAILGFARLLEEGDVDAGEVTTMISAIARQAQDVTDIVEDLLVSARADIGKLDVHNTSVEVVSLVEQTLEAGGSFTADVVLEVETDTVLAVGDPARIRQVLRNLLTNAERYGGSKVAVIVRVEGTTVLIEVTDDGPGLTPSQAARIFEPFQRAHERPGQPGSIGIGLAISRELAHLMGASLEYRFESGRSVFQLALEATDFKPTA